MKRRAFSLAEVIFAIVILSGSLIVLLGLQSSAIDKALRDKNQLDAMLLARNILAALEIQEEMPEGNIESSAIQLLKDYQGVPPDDFQNLEVFADFQAELRIEDWQTPPEIAGQLQSDAALLKKLYLKVFWSELPDDQVEVVYFYPAKK